MASCNCGTVKGLDCLPARRYREGANQITLRRGVLAFAGGGRRSSSLQRRLFFPTERLLRRGLHGAPRLAPPTGWGQQVQLPVPDFCSVPVDRQGLDFLPLTDSRFNNILGPNRAARTLLALPFSSVVRRHPFSLLTRLQTSGTLAPNSSMLSKHFHKGSGKNPAPKLDDNTDRGPSAAAIVAEQKITALAIFLGTVASIGGFMFGYVR